MRSEALIADLDKKAQGAILILDGAMGTMLQKYTFSEEQFRGDRFADWKSPVQGNNDLLNLTQPDAVRTIHTKFIEAGADLIETNTFSATTIAQGDYHMQDIAAEIAAAGARLAREAADAASKPVGVLGAIGPTNKTLSLSPDVNNPGYREVTFDDVRDAYLEQARAMAPGAAPLTTSASGS